MIETAFSRGLETEAVPATGGDTLLQSEYLQSNQERTIVMNYIEFVEKIIGNLDGELFCSFRNILVDEYLSFAAIKCTDVTQQIMKEKLCDYFEKVELKTGRSLEKIIEKYMADVDSIVSERIAAAPKAKKGATAQLPRARKYYDRACAIRKDNKMTKHGLRDYSRIMLCLYSEIIKNNRFKIIENFDYSYECINLAQIITAMRSETILLGKFPKFDTTSPYEADRCTFILVIMMVFYIRSTAVTEV